MSDLVRKAEELSQNGAHVNKMSRISDLVLIQFKFKNAIDYITRFLLGWWWRQLCFWLKFLYIAMSLCLIACGLNL